MKIPENGAPIPMPSGNANAVGELHPATPVGKTEQAERLKAAREFEQIFLRKMLSSLEKTGRPQNGGSVTSGADVYSSMVVGALADAMSAAGGIGLADLIVKSTTPGATAPAANGAPQVVTDGPVRAKAPTPAAQPGDRGVGPVTGGKPSG